MLSTLLYKTSVLRAGNSQSDLARQRNNEIITSAVRSDSIPYFNRDNNIRISSPVSVIILIITHLHGIIIVMTTETPDKWRRRDTFFFFLIFLILSIIIARVRDRK